jgi:hypothetical protein
MRPTRTTIGLAAFVAIQAISVIGLSANWDPDDPRETRFLLFLGLHLLMVWVACAIAALIWRGNGPPYDRPVAGPSSPPPEPSPAGLPIGPRQPAPLAVHAEPNAVDGG